MKMPSSTKAKLSKALKCIVLMVLMISSGWFMNDVWIKFKKKDTTFKEYEDQLTELPATVLCFQPMAKESVLKEYNVTLHPWPKSMVQGLISVTNDL